MSEPDWKDQAARALREDDAFEDITTGLVPSADERSITGSLMAEERLVVAGSPIVHAALGAFDRPGTYSEIIAEGDWADAGTTLGTITTDARTLLGTERVILNFLQRLSAIATQTRLAVDAAHGTSAVITDTRKTTPGLRDVEKYAVRVGGGLNHRRSLADAVLIKDNHWQLLDGTVESLARARASVADSVPFQVEVETVEQLDAVIAAGVTFILVDNQSPETVQKWKARVGPDVILEASGGIDVEQVAAYAQAGADRISMGCLTHSAGSVSIRLDVPVTR